MNLRETDITTLYVAFFNRVPDAEGLQYWHDSNMSMEEISQSFFVQDETVALYGQALDTDVFLNALYHNLFGRTPDADGAAYWSAELEGGVLGRAESILALVNGAQGDDQVVIQHKTEVAQYALGHGLTAGDYGLGDVTADPQSVEDANNGVDEVVAGDNPDDGNNGGGGTPAPTPWTVTAEAEADGSHVTSNEDAEAGLYDATTDVLVGATTSLTANVSGTVSVAAQGVMTETNLKATNTASGVTNTLNTVTLGTAGDDTFNGIPAQEDTFYGFDGDDSININQTGADTDSVFGGAGDDTIHIGDQLDANDIIDGGADNDVLIVRGTVTDGMFDGVSNMETLIFHDGGGVEAANATLGIDFFANSTWTQIAGTALNDTIDLSHAPTLGTAPAPGITIVGGDGTDTLTAGRYAVIDGGAGTDTIISSGQGAWDMMGGSELDIFVIADDPTSTHTPHILDFQNLEKIDFSPQGVDGNTGQDLLTAADFDDTLVATLAEGGAMPNDKLVATYNSLAGTEVYLDINNDNVFNEAVDIHVTVTAGTALVATDFFI